MLQITTQVKELNIEDKITRKYSEIACWRLVMFAEGKILEKRLLTLRRKTSNLNNFPVVCKHWPTQLHGDSSHPLLSKIVSTHSR